MVSLPIIIGERHDVEMEEWHCLLILWNLVQICTSPAIRKDDIPYLRILIEAHHTLFKRLYPNTSVIPKMHFLIHVPDDIARDMNLFFCILNEPHFFFPLAFHSVTNPSSLSQNVIC